MAGFDAVAMFVEEMSDEDDGFRYYQIFRPSDAMSSSGTRGAGFLVRVSYASTPSGSEGAITSDNAAIGVSSNADGTTIQLNAGAQYHVRRAIGIKVW